MGFKDGFDLRDSDRDTKLCARWTVTTTEVVQIRSWKLQPLLEQCKSDNVMSSVLRKAFPQSAIKKILSMDPARVSDTTQVKHDRSKDVRDYAGIFRPRSSDALTNR